MSMIDLPGAIAASDVIDALTEAGATVVWHGGKPAACKVLRLTTTVDVETAYEAIPAGYISANDDEDDWIEPDADDLNDFIAACRRGDRLMALSLLGRLNLSDSTFDRGERNLLALGGVA